MDPGTPPRVSSWDMTDGGSKGRGNHGRGSSSRGRGRGAEPPPPRAPPPRREEAPAHNNEPEADGVADDEEYLALAASITHMMRDEVASRDKLTKRVSELEQALTAAQHGETPPPLAAPELGASSGRGWRPWMARRSQGWEEPLASHCLGCSRAHHLQSRLRPLIPLPLNYPGGTQGDGRPARAQ